MLGLHDVFSTSFSRSNSVRYPYFLHKQGSCPLYVLWGMFVLCILLPFRHIPLDIEAGHFYSSVGANGNGLLEMSREFAFSIVGYLNLSLLALLDVILRVFRNGTSAGSDSLIDDQRFLTNIGKTEGATDFRILFREGAKVVRGLLKRNLSRLLSH